jgi:predicted transcriptional regulator
VRAPLNSTRANLQDLGDDVQRARNALDISQNEFARRAGVDQSVLSKLVRGLVLADPSLQKIRAYLSRVESKVARRRIRRR